MSSDVAPRPFRVLRLANSADFHSSVPPELRTSAVSGMVIEAALGVPVEIISRPVWPTARLPGVVDRWMDEVAPDAVLLVVTSFPFVYESFPLRVKRMLGRSGVVTLRAGERAAASRVGRTAAFRWTRRSLVQAFGGDTHFTSDEVYERSEQTIRVIIKREHVALAVRGPINAFESNVGRRAAIRGEERRVRVHAQIEALCASLHIEYVGRPILPPQSQRRERDIGDGAHFDAREHADRGRLEGEALVRAIRAQRAGS